MRDLYFQNSPWGQLPFANSTGVGLDDYEAPEEDWELDSAGFVPFPRFEGRDLHWIPPCEIERRVRFNLIEIY